MLSLAARWCLVWRNGHRGFKGYYKPRSFLQFLADPVNGLVYPLGVRLTIDRQGRGQTIHQPEVGLVSRQVFIG